MRTTRRVQELPQQIRDARQAVKPLDVDDLRALSPEEHMRVRTEVTHQAERIAALEDELRRLQSRMGRSQE